MVFDISTLALLDNACKEILQWVENSNQAFFALRGNLGSGKTTFVKHFLQLINEDISVSSPTYSIVNEYEVNGTLIYHYDLYRLNDIQEAFDIGIEDYFEKGKFHFIEWPELIDEILPENTYQFYFKSTNFERSLRTE